MNDDGVAFVVRLIAPHRDKILHEILRGYAYRLPDNDAAKGFFDSAAIEVLALNLRR